MHHVIWERTDDAVVRLHDVAVARERVRLLAVRYDEDGLQVAQVLVCPPGLGQLHARARELARVLLQLGLQALHECEGIGRGAGEARHDVLVDAAYFLGVGLDDRVAQRHLAVADQALRTR